MSGIDYLRAVVDGDLPQPPIAGLMQFDLVEVEPGRAVFTCVPDESAYNPIGAIHGRTDLHAVGLGDGMRGAHHPAAGHGRHVGRDQGELPQGGPAQQRPAHRNRHGREGRLAVGFAEGFVTDAGGTVVATATSTLLIFDL